MRKRRKRRDLAVFLHVNFSMKEIVMEKRIEKERKQEKGRDTAFAFFYFNFSLNNFCKKSRELKKKD